MVSCTPSQMWRSWAPGCRTKLIAHRCFQRLAASKLEHDPIIAIITNQTEEGRKVQRNEGTVYVNVFERVAGPG